MEQFDRKKHWENIYDTKQITEVSWYQPTPQTSLDIIDKFDLPKNAKIIDIGAGDSFLVDHLLERGYDDITVVDISDYAIEKAKKRLGKKAEDVKWIVADIADFHPTEKYDLWHDRAAFHFLTIEEEISSYLTSASNALNADGVLVIGTFSENGPTKCSGIEIRQYSEETMTNRFKAYFEKVSCEKFDHQTPFGTTQNFLFCSFRKK